MQAKEESFSEEEEEVEEDFDWIYDENCPEEMKKEFLKFPLDIQKNQWYCNKKEYNTKSDEQKK